MGTKPVIRFAVAPTATALAHMIRYGSRHLPRILARLRTIVSA
jgi:hypothetical protein